MPQTAPRQIADMDPHWLTEMLNGTPGFTGRVVRSFHYEEVATGPGHPGMTARVHLIFADAARATALVSLYPAVSVELEPAAEES